MIDEDVYDERDGDTPFYTEDFQYSLVEPNGWVQSGLWSDFRHSIAHEYRFFNDGAKRLLVEIFSNVHYLSDENKQPAFYALEPGTLLQRARGVRSIEVAREWAADPSRFLGPPPKHLRNAGRMNAAGIGAFYAAFDDPTCLAELRPLVGGLVCLASFRLRRPVHVLDFTRFERPGRNIDIFAKNYAARTTQWAFMQSFQQEISRPVLPDDTNLEYVPTQVVAEFLTKLPIQYRGVEQRIEGLVFRSAQRPGGHNLVLFGEAGQVVGGHDAEAPSSRSDFDFLLSMPAAKEPDPALEYELESFRIRRITSADFGCNPEFLPPEGVPDF
ncbi:RES family NAD+ phosphorylase [Sphingomonas sp. Xoc002]|uniref:RES family NAD+ phosphorylase n=1 Tax=Sphingomonas sp. Xoc002 TaxID=2837624 RepID=UPI003D167EDB